jgi:hypothetical protein
LGVYHFTQYIGFKFFYLTMLSRIKARKIDFEQLIKGRKASMNVITT